MKKLSSLDLGENKVSNLSPLAGLTNLGALTLTGNHVTDLSPLTGMKKLYNLRLSGNQVSDLSPLTGLTNLTWLYLDGNKISDILPLVTNSQTGELDTVTLQNNYLNLSEGSKAMGDIQTLINNGVKVEYKPQNPSPVPVKEDRWVIIMAIALFILIVAGMGLMQKTR
jgi:internalin A